MSNLKDFDDEAQRIFQKYSFQTDLKIVGKMKQNDRRNPFTYMVKKFVKYKPSIFQSER